MIKVTILADTHDKLSVIKDLNKCIDYYQLPYDTVLEAEHLTDLEIQTELEIINWLRRHKHNKQRLLKEMRHSI